MSRAPTGASSPDLERLFDEGYDLAIVDGHLMVRGVPYLDAAGVRRAGVLVVPLVMAGDRTAAPRGHGAHWAGELPHDRCRQPLSGIEATRINRRCGNVTLRWDLCSKAAGGEFVDYHELVTAYVAQISCHAVQQGRICDPRGERGAIPVESAGSPLRYMDTATARAGIVDLSARLSGAVGIVGLGGTGGYVLDLLAKTPVGRIHLFDDDVFLQHNAFRAPGAASLEDLRARRSKVDHFAAIYSRMHAGIVPHRVRVGEEPGSLGLLDRLSFCFLCMDDGGTKRKVVDRLHAAHISFVDVGIGMEVGPAGLVGSVRTTTSTPEMRSHVTEGHRVPFEMTDEGDIYGSNIQVADLNMLNAALAVVRWKRLCGFYANDGCEHHSVYDVAGGILHRADESRNCR